MENNNTTIIKNVKKELVEIGKKLSEKGFVIGPGGNTSVRVKSGSQDIVYMKASGICFETATEQDYIGIDLQTGDIIDGEKKPTCEILMHIGCYKIRNDISAVVHTHPPYSIIYAMSGKQLKAFTPDFVAIVASKVPVIKYVKPGGKELADEVSRVIKKYNAVFMTNHGLLTVGSNLKEAYYRTLFLEDSCKILIYAKLLGKMKFFTEKEYNELDNLDAEKYRRKMLKDTK